MKIKNKIRILVFVVCLLLVCGFADSLVVAEQNMSLKQKLEKDIVKTQIFHEQKFLVAVQEPIDKQTRMIDFKWQLIDWPFIMKYPASWYVRESYFDSSSLFITQEPIKEISDQYQVGMCLHYYPNYFNIQKPVAVADIGKIAYDLVFQNKWENSKKEYIEKIKQQAQSVMSVKDIDLAGRPAVRLEFKSEGRQILLFYLKNNNDLLLIAFQAPIAEFNKYSNVFNMMMESFYFK